MPLNKEIKMKVLIAIYNKVLQGSPFKQGKTWGDGTTDSVVNITFQVMTTNQRNKALEFWLEMILFVAKLSLF